MSAQVESWPVVDASLLVNELRYAISESRRVNRRPDKVLVREWEWAVLTGVIVEANTKGSIVDRKVTEAFAFMGVPMFPLAGDASPGRWFELVREL